jgi:hypothetical protein
MKLLRITLLIILAAATLHTGTFVSGSTTCPASGNARVATNNTGLFQLTVSANTTNTGFIHVGGSDVTITSGAILAAGASYNANKPSAGLTASSLYFACTVSADTIGWVGSY